MNSLELRRALELILYLKVEVTVKAIECPPFQHLVLSKEAFDSGLFEFSSLAKASTVVLPNDIDVTCGNLIVAWVHEIVAIVLEFDLAHIDYAV
jgi:hypothetical protein